MTGLEHPCSIFFLRPFGRLLDSIYRLLCVSLGSGALASLQLRVNFSSHFGDPI